MVCSTVGVHLMAEKECASAHDQMFQEALHHLREELQRLSEQVQKRGEQQVGRIAAVEESQKTVLVSARKSLEVVVKVQRQQERWEAKRGDLQREDLDVTKQRTSPQAMSSKSSPSSLHVGWCAQQQTCGSLFAELDAKIDQQTRRFTKMDREIATLLGAAGAEKGISRHFNQIDFNSHGDGRQGLLQSLEANFESGLADAARRLDALQSQMDDASAPLFKISNAMPEVLGRLDSLMAQSQQHASKLSQQEVRFDMLAGHMDVQSPSLVNGSGGLNAMGGGSGPCSDVSGVEDRELAGRVDAHSLAISEIFDQLQTHSNTLGMSHPISRSSSRGSLHRNPQVLSYLQQSTPPTGSRASSRGSLNRHQAPPPLSLSAASFGLLKSQLPHSR